MTAEVRPSAPVLTAPATTVPRPPSPAQRFARHGGAVVGLGILAVIVLVAVVGPWLAPTNLYLSSSAAQLLPPGPAHIFGTDDLGRDVAARMLHGAILSLQMGFIAVGIAVVLGLLLGLPAGYFGGKST